MCSRADEPTQHDVPAHVHRPALGTTLHDTALETGRTEDSVAFALVTTAERCAWCPARLVIVGAEDWRPITPADVFMDDTLEDKR